MPFITLRSERSLAEIAERLFVGLTPQERKRVETALRRANPALSDPARITGGFVIEVPDIPELRTKSRREQEPPSTRLAEALIASLEASDEALAKAMEAERMAAKQQRETLETLLRSSATGAGAELLQTADQAAKQLEQRDKQLQARSEQLFHAVRMIREDLKAQAQRNG